MANAVNQSRHSSLYSDRVVGEAVEGTNTAAAQVTDTSGAAGSHQPPPPALSRRTPQEPPKLHDPPATDHTASDARAFLMRTLRWERRLAELRAAHGRAPQMRARNTLVVALRLPTGRRPSGVASAR